MVVDGLLHEAIDFFWYFFCGVKECLLLIVLPVQREVHDANCFPKVAQLGPRTIDHSCHFVGHDEFQILYNHTETCSKAPVSKLMMVTEIKWETNALRK